MMALALAEARKGWGRTSPNPMVGAVVTRGGEVIARGYHARAGGPHAEVEALRKAGELARGATIYVTLEPCNHQGKTPPCTRAILAAGIKRVVIGEMDPNPRVEGGGASFLAAKGLEVTTGVLRGDCAELIEFFRKHITTGRPFVLLKSAATLDGKIATAAGHSRWVTGEKARAYVHRLRNGVDAILVGRGTVALDDPTLNTRLPGKKTGKDPVRVVLDTNLSSEVAARVFNPELGGKTIVACGPEPAAEKARMFEERGVEVLKTRLAGKGVSLAAVLDVLGGRGITSVLIEGGAQINAAALLDERMVDKAVFFYAPKIVGGDGAPTLVGGQGVSNMADSLRMDVTRVRRMGPDLMVEAVPRY